MSLCPHGYTAFWDCPTCPEPMGTADADEPQGCAWCGRPTTDWDVDLNKPMCAGTTCRAEYLYSKD